MNLGRPEMSLTDAVLVRYLDGEAEAAEVRAVEGAGAGSAVAARLWELSDASRRLGEVVAELPVGDPPPLRVPRRRWEAKAAGVALLLAAGALTAMPPARSAVADGWGRALEWVRSASSGVNDGGAATGDATVSVAYAGGRFVLEIEQTQRAGYLRVHPGEGGDVAVRAGDAELVVLPGRIRVRNGRDAADDIVMTVPLDLRGLTVRIAGVERVIGIEEGSAPTVIPLGVAGR